MEAQIRSPILFRRKKRFKDAGSVFAWYAVAVVRDQDMDSRRVLPDSETKSAPPPAARQARSRSDLI